MRMRSYEPAEFVSVLASNQPLAAPMDLTVYGLVKADESDSSVLLLSISNSCERWIPIPVSLISSIEHGGYASCKDHEHPFVRIVLAEPTKDDVGSSLRAALCSGERKSGCGTKESAQR